MIAIFSRNLTPCLKSPLYSKISSFAKWEEVPSSVEVIPDKFGAHSEEELQLQLYCRFGWWVGNLYCRIWWWTKRSADLSDQPLTPDKEIAMIQVRLKFIMKQQQIQGWVPLVSSQKPMPRPRYLNVKMLEANSPLLSAKWMRIHWNMNHITFVYVSFHIQTTYLKNFPYAVLFVDCR